MSAQEGPEQGQKDHQKPYHRTSVTQSPLQVMERRAEVLSMNKALAALALTVVAATPALAHGSGGAAVAKPASAPVASGSKQAAINFALAQVGDRYVWGGTGPNGWDCSGLMQAAFRQAGINLPRVSSAQKAAGTRIPLSALQPGDLVAYPGHVALYIGNGKQVAATNPRTGVRVQAVYRGAQFGVRL